MKPTRFLFLALLISTSCATLKQGDDANSIADFTHQKIIDELKSRKSHRSPASLQLDLGLELRDLNRIRPEKFEIYVFPKIFGNNIKTNEEVIPFLGKPTAFEVSVIALSSCREFVRNNLFSKYTAGEVFAEVAGDGHTRQCSIVEFTSKSLRQINRKDLKKDDLLKVRLFLDDEYVIHATDYELYQSPNSKIVSRIKTNGEEAFSGLNLYPVELPSKWSKGERVELDKVIADRIDNVSSFQIKRKLNKNFSLPQCRGIIFDQKNSLGEKTQIGWCEKIPWPSFIENSRFISIIQPLSLK